MKRKPKYTWLDKFKKRVEHVRAKALKAKLAGRFASHEQERWCEDELIRLHIEVVERLARVPSIIVAALAGSQIPELQDAARVLRPTAATEPAQATAEKAGAS